MADLQINQIKLPQLRELTPKQDGKVDKGFQFTLLSHIEEADLQETLKLMIDKITEQGNKISEHMDIRDIRMYRMMIAEFVNEVVSNGRQFSRDSFLDRRGRHRVYGIVRVINEKVDELGKEFLKAEKSHLDILERIGEIQGLLLDIAT